MRRCDGKRFKGVTGGEVDWSEELRDGLHFGTVNTLRGWFVDAGERRRTSSPSKSPSRHARWMSSGCMSSVSGGMAVSARGQPRGAR